MGGNECHGRHILGLCNKILAGIALVHVRRVQSASEDRFATIYLGRWYSILHESFIYIRPFELYTGQQNDNFFLAEHLRVFSGVFKVADHEYDISFARLALV